MKQYNTKCIISVIKKNIRRFVEQSYAPDIYVEKINARDPLNRLIAKLCYHNYSNWQHENNAKSNIDDVSLRGYRATVKSNHNRNSIITEIDEYCFKNLQNNEAENVLPVTLGTIIDSISVLFLKITYLNSDKSVDTIRIKKIKQQIKEITKALEQSLDRVCNQKTFRFIKLDKIKIYKQKESCTLV